MAWTKEQNRAYQAEWRAKNREKVKERAREWWRAKYGSIPREEWLAKMKAEAVARSAAKAAVAREKRKRERRTKPEPVAAPAPKPKAKPAPRAAPVSRKPGRLLAMAGFVRNW